SCNSTRPGAGGELLIPTLPCIPAQIADDWLGSGAAKTPAQPGMVATTDQEAKPRRLSDASKPHARPASDGNEGELGDNGLDLVYAAVARELPNVVKLLLNN